MASQLTIQPPPRRKALLSRWLSASISAGAADIVSGPRYDQPAISEPSYCSRMPSSIRRKGQKQICQAPAVSGDVHYVAFALSPSFRNSGQLRENAAFGRIPFAISQVTDINLPEQWIGFAHPAQNGHYSEPKCRRHCESPDRQQAESQAKRREQSGQNQHRDHSP